MEAQEAVNVLKYSDTWFWGGPMVCSSEHRFNEVNDRTRGEKELNTRLIEELDAELDRVIEEALNDDIAAYLEAQLCVACHDYDGDTVIWNSNYNRNLWETETDEEENEDGDDFLENDFVGLCTESESEFESEVSTRSDYDSFSEEYPCSPISDIDTLVQQYGDPSAHVHHSRVMNLALMCEGVSLSSTQLSSVGADLMLKDVYTR